MSWERHDNVCPSDRQSQRHHLLTLVTADALEADAAVAGPGDVVTGGVVHALTQLLAAITERPRRTLWTGGDRGSMMSQVRP